MSRAVDFHWAVDAEVTDAKRWYDQQQPGLGDDFLDAVEAVYAEIVVNPARYGYAEGDIREGVTDGFPYAVYYRVKRDRIRVLAVYHTSRDPAGWRHRV